jgi:hypothetical protein
MLQFKWQSTWSVTELRLEPMGRHIKSVHPPSLLEYINTSILRNYEEIDKRYTLL